jgi:hypothetical protein
MLGGEKGRGLVLRPKSVMPDSRLDLARWRRRLEEGVLAVGVLLEAGVFSRDAMPSGRCFSL